MKSTIEEGRVGEVSEVMPCLVTRERLTIHELWIVLRLGLLARRTADAAVA
jgi:hypothetical protein